MKNQVTKKRKKKNNKNGKYSGKHKNMLISFFKKILKIIGYLKQKYVVGFNIFLYLYICKMYHNKSTKDWEGNSIGKCFKVFKSYI